MSKGYSFSSNSTESKKATSNRSNSSASSVSSSSSSLDIDISEEEIETIVDQLYQIFNCLKSCMPEKSKTKINVLSLASGIASEFFALKKYYGEKGFNFVGIDNDEENNKLVRDTFQTHENLHLLTADASNLDKVYKVLKESNLLPEKGFDFVILRHPDVMSYPQEFSAMIKEVIPAVSTEKGIVFISCYYDKEMTKVIQYTANECFSAPKNNYMALKNNINHNLIINFGNNEYLEPDKHSIIFNCNGFAFENCNGQDVANKKEAKEKLELRLREFAADANFKELKKLLESRNFCKYRCYIDAAGKKSGQTAVHRLITCFRDSQSDPTRCTNVENAMALLRDHGARQDVKDVNGKSYRDYFVSGSASSSSSSTSSMPTSSTRTSNTSSSVSSSVSSSSPPSLKH